MNIDLILGIAGVVLVLLGIFVSAMAKKSRVMADGICMETFGHLAIILGIIAVALSAPDLFFGGLAIAIGIYTIIVLSRKYVPR